MTSDIDINVPLSLRKKRATKLIILVVLLLVACFFVYVYNKPDAVTLDKRLQLQDFLSNIDGYKIASHVGMEENIYQFLDLDDYVFTNYAGTEGRVNLFIGFYYTADKLSAAHSPLVCYPAQGWLINNPVMHRLTVAEHDIHYAEIIASLGEDKELILYWFQAHEKTTPHVYRNKINTIFNKITRQQEQNALVRVSVPFTNSSYDKAKKTATDFIEVFYPDFIDFINKNDSPLP